jgi:hypothetical protein
MCPTTIGRIHTRVFTIFGPFLLGGILSLITGELDWIVIIGIYLLMGTFLDTVIYPLILKWQPPWMTGILATAELGLLLVLIGILSETAGGEIDVPIWQAVLFYIGAFILASIIRIVILPIFALTYIESAAEIRRNEWSVPPQQVAVPVLASASEARAGPGPLVRSVSGVHAKPLEQLPAPSGVHAVPAQS